MNLQYNIGLNFKDDTNFHLSLKLIGSVLWALNLKQSEVRGRNGGRPKCLGIKYQKLAVIG